MERVKAAMTKLQNDAWTYAPVRARKHDRTIHGSPHECVQVSIYACANVCMYGRMDVGRDTFAYGCVYGRANVRVHEWGYIARMDA